MTNLYKLDVYDYLYLFENLFIHIDDSFNLEIKNKIKLNYGSLNKFNLLFFQYNKSTFNWGFKKNNSKHNYSKLKKMCEILNISIKDLHKNILGFYYYGSKNSFNPNRWIIINDFFVEGYALYLAEGDTGFSGSKSAKKLRFTNSNIDVIKFYISWMKCFFDDYYYVNIYYPNNISMTNLVNEYFFNIDIHLYSDKYVKKVKYRVCNDKLFYIQCILLLNKHIKKIVLTDFKLSCAYVRGMMAGEGTVYNNGKNKYLRIEMKNKEEIAYLKKLFSKLNINYTYHTRKNRYSMESLYVGGLSNMKRYLDLVGFGSESNRQKKLEDIFS
jgi:hypothetical protein